MAAVNTFSLSDLSSYSIPAHVHACTTDDGTVILDLRSNIYIGLDLEESAIWELIRSPAISPYTTVPMSGNTTSDLSRAETLVQCLSGKGIITKGSRTYCDQHQRIVRARADLELKGNVYPSNLKPTAKHWMEIVRAFALASWALRFRSLESIVSDVEARKQHGVGAAHTDIDLVRNLIWVFSYMRPFVYSGADRCLLETLTLMNFMIRHGVHPDWVFGIKSRPFKAHTWLELHRYALDELPHVTHSYVPILTI